ncbi:hypothetical protein BBJ28_00002985 [Nothophytophthora sp. Chile5]|nr:hypothetical protein BBJ28_00002985 [Nothophytophthora sp. Chile5]
MGPRKTRASAGKRSPADVSTSKKKAGTKAGSKKQQTLTKPAKKTMALRRTRRNAQQEAKHDGSSDDEFNMEEPDADDAGDEEQAQEPVKTRRVETRKPSTRGTPDRQEVLSGTYLASAGRNSSALSKRLKQTWEALQKTPSRQQQRDDGILDATASEKLGLVCAELLQEKIMEHADKNVRSLAACCLVEFMRVHAPDTPFKSNEELYRVFQLLFEQLRSLAAVDTDGGARSATTTSSDLHSFHVLESLAAVKSCLLLVGMDFTVEEGEPTMMVQLFRTLFDTIRSEHSAKIENLMLSMMVACIEESDGIELPLLDVILDPLVNSTTPNEVNELGEIAAERSPSHMAQELIRRTSEHLQSPLSHFFNSILIDAPARLGSQQPSELKEHVYTLIYEVHKINPSLLLYVLPNVCLQLQVDEVATRSDAISLMGKLFASSRADYGHLYMKNFRDFLGRFRDASKEIRLQMVQTSVSIWEHKSELASLLEAEFILRLSDPEWEVRQLVVHELCDFAANRLELISEGCLRAVGERMKDKKVVLRKETMTGLSQVYSTHISSYWEEEDEDKPLSLSHRNIPAAHIKKLGWIPDYVLKCFAYRQQELKLRVVQLLDDFLLPKACSERIRANGLMLIYHSLDATSKEALRRIFNERAKCQSVCQRFVSFKIVQRQKARGASQTDDSTLEKAKQQFYDGLSPLFPDVGNLRKLLERLAKWKDQSVFKHMGELCDFSKSQSETRHARDQLVRCIGSKTPLGEFLKKLCRKLSLLTMNQASIAAFLGFLISREARPSKENRSIVDMLVMSSSTLPELFAPFIKEEFEAILIENDAVGGAEDDEEGPLPRDPKVVIGALNVLANYSSHWKANNDRVDDELSKKDESAMPSAALTKQLRAFCLGESDDEIQNLNSAKESQAAELAALTLANFYGTTQETRLLIDNLCSKEKLRSPDAAGASSTLQSLEVFAKRCGQLFSTDKPMLSRLWASLIDDFIVQGVGPASADAPASKERKHKGGKPAVVKLAEVRCLAVKVAVNLLVYCRSAEGPAVPRESGTKLIKLLFDILRSDGNTWTANATLAANFRATASCGLMKLMRNRPIEASISVSEWHLLGFTMQDSSEEVRRKFVKKLTAHLMKHSVQHPHKYLSYLALAATDSSVGLKKAVRSLLKIAVERMRRVFDAASSRDTDTENSPDQVGSSVNALMVPEYSLPYVIHLLAHHPDFPNKLVARTPTALVLQSALWTGQLTYVGFFLDGLISANTAAADNIAFLLQILTKLSQCHDVTSPETKHIYPLIDSAVALLKKKIKKQSNLKPFPGKIYLPKHLYGPGRKEKVASAMETSRKEPEELYTTAATKKPGPRIITSLSPIKPADFAAHFMKLNSPPGSSLKKRKRSSHEADGGRASKALTAAARESKQEGDDSDASDSQDGQPTSATPPRRQSLMRKARTEKRTFADDSDSGADSDAFLSRSSVTSRSNKPHPLESRLPAVGTDQNASDADAEEKEDQGGLERMAHEAATSHSGSPAAEVATQKMVRSSVHLFLG